MATMTRVNPRVWSHMSSKNALGRIMETYAKNANKRLRAIERAGLEKSSNAYRAVESFHEGNLEFMTTGRSGNINFKRGYKDRDIEEIRREIETLDTFLFRVKTSTVKGTKEHYKKIKKTLETTENVSPEFNQIFKDMNMEDFNSFWSIKNIAKLIQMYGSDIVIKIKSMMDDGISKEALDELVTDLTNEQLTIRQVNSRIEEFELRYDFTLANSDDFDYDDFMNRN